MATTTVEPNAVQQQVVRPLATIQDLLKSDQLKKAVSAALPRHMTPERFMRVAINATLRNPDLLNCTKESFLKCLLDLSALGLEADGRRAHLIPFKRNFKTEQGWQSVLDVQLIVDYKGIAELVRRSGEVSYIHADVVFENDEWDFGYGSGAFLKHKPNLEDRGKRIVAVYSFVKLRDGSEDFIVLSRAEVEAVRARSRAKDSGPWVTDWNEMAKKTAFRRHSKWLPLSPETRDVVEKDDDFTGVDIEGVLDSATDAPPVAVGSTLKDRLKAATARAEEEPVSASPAPPALPEWTTLPDHAAWPEDAMDAKYGRRIIVVGVCYQREEVDQNWKPAFEPAAEKPVFGEKATKKR